VIQFVKKEKKDDEKTEITISVLNELGEVAKKVRKEELEGELSAASLQVLTICAYLGPISKSEISFIRGVQSTQSIRSLSSRGLITKENEKLEAIAVRGITCNKNEAKITICDVPDRPGVSADIFNAIAKAGVNVDVIVQNVSHTKKTDISFTVPKSDIVKAIKATEDISRKIGAGGQHLRCDGQNPGRSDAR
jgi:aspartokinase